LQGFNYQENVKHYEERDDDFKKVSTLTLVSNMELGIKVQDVSYTDDCMIDANMIGMMSKTGIPDSTGSHTVTGASVLNQMMIKSKRITKDYSKYCSERGDSDILEATDYLVQIKLGTSFMEITLNRVM